MARLKDQVVGGDESGSPVIAYNASVQRDIDRDTSKSKLRSKTSSLSEATTEDSITEDGDSDYSVDTPSRSRDRAMSSPRTKTTITTTNARGGTSTTIQYSGASGVSLDSVKDEDGSVTLRPIPQRNDRKVKVKKVITFTPRISHFDRFHPTSQGDTFRGFYVLFWMLMGLTMIRVLYHSYLKSGEVVGLRFARLISKDAVVLAISDAVLVGVTILSVPFVKLIQRGWIRYHNTGLIIQHIAQCLFLGSAIRWTFYRHWYWVQSGFLVLHSLTMLMKTHSYIAYNGLLSEKAIKLRAKRAELDKAVNSKGGWSQVLQQADKEAEQLQEKSGETPHLNGSSLNGMAAMTVPSDQTEPTGSSLRRRRSSQKSVFTPKEGTVADGRDPRRFLHFSDETIWNLAHDCVELQEELISTGKDAVVWPANVTYRNYFDYLLVPTLVYELEYPRTSTIRPLYVLEKTLATFGTFFIILAITEHVIIPTHEAAKANPLTANSFIASALDLVMPFMINYLLIFYIIFECICNGFAELTRFADRGFYEDWWNAVTWDEFARKWNKPVHQFLLRHVYASTIAAFHLSKFQATFVTFLLSACLHEMVMMIVSKKFRMYLFIMQMLQLPMMAAGRLPLMRKNPTLGNMFFWAGLIWGFPLLAVGYLRF